MENAAEFAEYLESVFFVSFYLNNLRLGVFNFILGVLGGVQREESRESFFVRLSKGSS